MQGLNPECRAGKHGSCFGDSWDDVEDAPAACPCSCHPASAVAEPTVTADFVSSVLGGDNATLWQRHILGISSPDVEDVVEDPIARFLREGPIVGWRSPSPVPSAVRDRDRWEPEYGIAESALGSPTSRLYARMRELSESAKRPRMHMTGFGDSRPAPAWHPRVFSMPEVQMLGWQTNDGGGSIPRRERRRQGPWRERGHDRRARERIALQERKRARDEFRAGQRREVGL